MSSSVLVQSVVMIVLFSFIHMSSSARIELFDHRDHRGTKLVGMETYICTIFIFDFYSYLDRSLGDRDGSCYNVDDWANDRASSINTHGGCFTIYEHKDCHGDSRRIQLGGGCHHQNFEDCGFNDKLSSYRLCW